MTPPTEPREPRILVLNSKLEYQIFGCSENDLSTAVGVANTDPGSKIYRLTDHIRTNSAGEKEITTRSKKIWPT